MGCACVKPRVGYEDPAILAAQTCFKEIDVKALHELFRKLSSSLYDDDYISREEFQLGLFRNSNEHNLFADRIFHLFDSNHDGVLDFGEFVRSLSIFHPDAPHSDKVAFLFSLYDLQQTGYIEREELEGMVLALLRESDLDLPIDLVEWIVEKTMMEADTNGDGKIDEEEWSEFVKKNPSIMKNMTLPYLKDLTLAFPSFVINTKVADQE